MFWVEEVISSREPICLLSEAKLNICEFTFWFQCRGHYEDMDNVLQDFSKEVVYTHSESRSNQKGRRSGHSVSEILEDRQ